LTAGRALEVGMGDGRNAISSHKRGWDATGIDLAETGIALAKKRVAELGVRFNALIQE